LYRGKVGLEMAEAQHLYQGLDWPGAVADIAASAKWLREHGSPKVMRSAKNVRQKMKHLWSQCSKLNCPLNLPSTHPPTHLPTYLPIGPSFYRIGYQGETTQHQLSCNRLPMDGVLVAVGSHWP
jgi:hypothetical protein